MVVAADVPASSFAVILLHYYTAYARKSPGADLIDASLCPTTAAFVGLSPYLP